MNYEGISLEHNKQHILLKETLYSIHTLDIN